MRIGTGNNNSTDYSNENNQLKKLHQQRMKRQNQQKLNHQMQSQHQSEHLNKQIIHQNKFNNKNQLSCPQNLFLNSLLSDNRKITKKQNAIAISSLFQQNPKNFSTHISKQVKSVFITTYGFQMDVLGNIAQSGVPFFVVNDTQQNGQGKIQRNYQGFSNMSLIIPPRTNKGYGVFHTKIWLIRFTTFIRVVIGTGNQHTNDWIVWLNSFWYQDFSLTGTRICDYQIKKQQKKTINNKSEKQKSKKQIDKFDKIISIFDSDDQQNEKTLKKQQQTKFNYDQDFKQTLIQVITKMLPKSFNFEKQTGINFDKYDFSNIKVVLIPSIPGRYLLKDGQMKKYGMAKVKTIMKNLGPKIKKGMLTYNSSSLGIVEPKFLKQLYMSFLPYAQSFSTSNYRLIYPTYKYINQQTCGQSQVLFLKKQNYYKSEIRKQVFYHYEPSTRNPVKGAIPHLKTVIVESCQDKQSKKCIFFMGSHNMTKAAWGTYQKNQTQISFSNSQLGILFLQMDKQKLLNWLPFNYPPRKYGDSQKPFLMFS